MASSRENVKLLSLQLNSIIKSHYSLLYIRQHFKEGYHQKVPFLSVQTPPRDFPRFYYISKSYLETDKHSNLLVTPVLDLNQRLISTKPYDNKVTFGRSHNTRRGESSGPGFRGEERGH